MPELRAEATVVGDFNPNDEINRADKTSDWQGKLSGAYLFPYDITVGANFDHQSGDAFARQVLLEGRGDHPGYRRERGAHRHPTHPNPEPPDLARGEELPVTGPGKGWR